MTRVPILTEVVLRAWGTDDPRLLPLLRAENQPGAFRRAKAIGDRAHAVGWPVETTTMVAARAAQARALQRLERSLWGHQQRRTALPGAGLGRKPRSDDVYETNDALVSIFDE
jgi:hypothetical protein